MKSLSERLTAALATGGTPGGGIGIWQDGETELVASGLANQEAAIEADTETLFPIGSITKAFTATLVMQLVDSGQVQLDAPIQTWLPRFRRDQPVTVRQLLCHSSGIDGDLTTDFGRDADAVEKLVDALEEAEQLHPPGAFFSYCNAGYIVLARLLERIHGESWDEIMAKRLLAPLGLERTVTLPDEALKRRYAIGTGGRPFHPRSNGPSGMTMAATAGDLIRFAGMHLEGGVGENKARILSEAAVTEMQRCQIVNPVSAHYDGWGLGWMLRSGEDAFGHDGGIEGACAFLRVWPKDRRILALTINRGNAVGIWRDLSGEHAPTPPPQTPVNLDLSGYAGRYRRHGQTIDVVEAGTDLAARLHGEYVGEPRAFRLRPCARDRFAILAEGLPQLPAHFLPYDAKEPLYLHTGDRLFRREVAA